MDWLFNVGSAVSALGGLVGGAAANRSNLKAVEDTNATNRSIAQMNNAYNERMMKEQMRYNTMMWEKENAYNTAAMQAQRLREAGLNPAMVMSGQNAGTAGSVGGITPPTASPVTMQAGQIDNSYIGESLDKLSQGFQIMKQLQNDKARLAVEEQNANANLIAALAKSDNLKVVTEGQKILNSYLDQQEKSRLANLDADTAMKIAQKEFTSKQGFLLDVQKLIADKQLGQMDELHQKQLAEIGSRISLNRAQSAKAYEETKLTKENIKKVSVDIKETAERTYGIQISNKEAELLAPYVLQRAQFDAVPTPEQEAYYYTDENGKPLRDYKVHKVGNMYKRYGSGYELPFGLKLGIGK